jgi:hypothetical protein
MPAAFIAQKAGVLGTIIKTDAGIDAIVTDRNDRPAAFRLFIKVIVQQL